MNTEISILKKMGLASAVMLSFSWTAAGQTKEKPNILWIVSEDNSASYMGCYGNDQATTPNIDELSQEGVTYDRAFANAPVSAPARSTIITGVYASTMGTQHMRSNNDIPDKIRFFPEYLRKAGYYCTNNSKEDYNIDQATWKRNVARAWNESSGKAHYKNREKGQPFFAVFNIAASHESRIHYHRQKEDDEFLHSPEDMKLAPYHPDVPEMRRTYAQYYDCITNMDRKVGALIDELEERGLAENTLVFYYGDHGGVVTRSKRFVFESGIRVPMIVRFPEKYQHLAPGKPGSREGRLVSFVDLAPTLLSLAGVDIPEYMQGHAFLGNQKSQEPEYVHLFRGRMDERYDMMRALRTDQYLYIRNYMPHRIYGQHLWYLWRSPSTRAWQKAYQQGQCNAVQSRFWNTKPAEELYDIQKDPHNINNLAGDARYQDVLKTLRKENQHRIRENRGAGFLPEAMMKIMAKERTIYEMTHSPDYPADKIISAAEIASRKDPRKIPDLIANLTAEYPAVRYWAATGCAIMPEEAGDAIPRLKEMLDDPYGNNRIAAAEALCRMGVLDRSLQVLLEAMKHEDEWVQLHALNTMQSLGERVKPIEKEILGNPIRKESRFLNNTYRRLVRELGWVDYH